MISAATSADQKQLELMPQPAPDLNVVWLEDLLQGAQCWMSARDIIQTTGGRVIDRDVREYASKSDNILSGQKGYLHIRHASADEVNRACNWMESQARKMSERAARLRKRAHEIFG